MLILPSKNGHFIVKPIHVIGTVVGAVASIITIFTFAVPLSQPFVRTVLDSEIVKYTTPSYRMLREMGTVEQRIVESRQEGIDLHVPSNSVFTIKFLGLPSLDSVGSQQIGRSDAYAILVNVSPLQSLEQRTVFEGGECHFGGTATSFNRDKMVATFEVHKLSCIDDQAIAHQLSAEALGQRRLGYVASKIGDPSIPVIKIHNQHKLDARSDYFLIFDKSIDRLKKLE